MAEFSRLVITKSGQALLSEILTEGGKLEFSRVCVSDVEIPETALEMLETLSQIRQESPVSDITKTSEQAVMVEAAFSNTDLTEGYFMRTLGLFTKHGNADVLYAAAVETSGHCYMPPYNGVTVSGAMVQLVTAVGNSEKVSFEVDPAGMATIARLNEEIAKHNADENAHGNMLAKPVSFSVDVSAWTELSEPFAGCAYSAETTDENVTAADFPEIFFDEASLETAGNIAVIAASGEGKVILYAKQIPEITLSGTYFIRKGAAV